MDGKAGTSPERQLLRSDLLDICFVLVESLMRRLLGFTPSPAHTTRQTGPAGLYTPPLSISLRC